MNSLIQHLRYAFRRLAKSRGFTGIAVLTMALAIGANTAIYTVVNEALLRPRAGIGHPEQLVDIGRTDDGRGFDTMSYPNFRDARERNQSLQGMAALMVEPRPMSLQVGAGSERVYATAVSGSYFQVLEANPHLGRFFLSDEDGEPLAQHEVVLSHAFWRQRFQEDRGVVGRDIKLNGGSYVVIGVAAPGFHGTVPLAPDLWVPITSIEELRDPNGFLACRSCSGVFAIGRLKPGVGADMAQAEFRSIAHGLAQEFPRDNEGRGFAVLPSRLLPGELHGMVATFLGLLMAIVGLVMVIASVNVAGMMLVRAITRRRDTAVRLAIGAGRAHIVGQFLAEGVLVFLAGGAVGLLLAVWLRQGLLSLLPAMPYPLTFHPHLDWRVVTFALLVSLLGGIAASVVPVMEARRVDLLSALKDDSNAPGLRRMRLRNALVLGQVSLSLVLLVCAGLFLRALDRATRMDPGFEMKGLHVLSMNLSLARYDPAGGTVFAGRFLERVRAMQGVTSASWAWSVPLDGGGRGLGAFKTPGRRSPGGDEFWDFDWSVVTPGYFETMKIPVVRGRDFSEDDVSGGTDVAIINEHAARSIWPNEDPIGKTFQNGDFRDPASLRSIRIVGVARDQRYRSLQDRPRHFVFLPLRQRYIDNLSLLVRTPNAAVSLPAIRRALQEENPALPILNVLSMHEYAALSLFPQKVASWVSGTLGLVGLLLVGLGVYGVTAFSVAQRTREIGIRMALGAQSRQVLRLVLEQGLRLTAWGVGIGLVLAALAARLLIGLLHGLSVLDPVTFGGVAALVLGIAALATLIPARRATRVDPLVALRYE